MIEAIKHDKREGSEIRDHTSTISHLLGVWSVVSVVDCGQGVDIGLSNVVRWPIAMAVNTLFYDK